MVASPITQGQVNLAYSQAQLRSQGIQGLQQRQLEQQQVQRVLAEQRVQQEAQQKLFEQQIQEQQTLQTEQDKLAQEEAKKQLSKGYGPTYLKQVKVETPYQELVKYYIEKGISEGALIKKPFQKQEPLMLPRTGVNLRFTPQGQILEYKPATTGEVIKPSGIPFPRPYPVLKPIPSKIQQKKPSFIVPSIFLPKMPSQTLGSKAFKTGIVALATGPVGKFFQPVAERELKVAEENRRISELRRTGQISPSLPYGLQPSKETPIGKFQITRALISGISLGKIPLSKIAPPQSEAEQFIDVLVKGELFAPYLTTGAAAKQKVVQKTKEGEKTVYVRKFSDLDEESQVNLLRQAQTTMPEATYREALRTTYRKALQSGNSEKIKAVERLFNKLMGGKEAQAFFRDIKQQEMIVTESMRVPFTTTPSKVIEIAKPKYVGGTQAYSEVILATPTLKGAELGFAIVQPIGKLGERQLNLLGTQPKLKYDQLVLTNQILKTEQKLEQPQRLTQPQIQKPKLTQPLISIPALKTEQRLEQPTVQISRFAKPQQPTKPKTPFPIGKAGIRKKEAISLLRRKAYSVFTKRRGKLVELGKGLPLGRAKKLGIEVARRTLARSVLIKQAGTTELQDITFGISPSEFRLPKRTTAGFELQLVQRKALTRGTGEVGEIQMFKRQKARRVKFL